MLAGPTISHLATLPVWHAGRLLTAWHLSPTGILLAVALLAGLRWSGTWWRRGVYLVLGIGSLLYVTCGPVGTYAHVLLWCFGVKVATLVAVTPFGLAVGVDRLPLRSRWLRAASFPLLSSVVAAASVTAVFFTGYGQAAVTHPALGAVLVVHLLAVGLLVAVPLLTEDLLPSWATPPVRALLACVDGLLDALPGILVMTSSALLMPKFPGFSDPARGHTAPALDQKWAGGALIAVAEVVGLPMLLAVFAAWVRHDRESAARIDAELDAQLGGKGTDEADDGLWWVARQRDGR